MNEAELRQQIKSIMVENLMLKITPAEIGDDQPLFGPGSLGLDSVDALQLVVALEKSPQHLTVGGRAGGKLPRCEDVLVGGEFLNKIVVFEQGGGTLTDDHRPGREIAQPLVPPAQQDQRGAE